MKTLLIIIVLFAFITLVHNISWNSKIEISNDITVSGTIDYVESERGNVLLRLHNDDEEYYVSDSYNYLYDNYRLSDFIEIGDSINKPEGSDTIFVYRKNLVFFFRIGKFINEVK